MLTGKEITVVEENVYEEEKRVINYTRSEAIRVVLNLANKAGGTFPIQEDYEKAEKAREIDIDGLVMALGVRPSMERNHTKPYAALNIAVLRELRAHEGKPKRIVSEDPSTRWIRSIKM